MAKNFVTLPTSFQIPGSDTTVHSSVVCDHVHGSHILVVKCVAMVINDGTPGQHAEVSSGSSTNHLTVQCYTLASTAYTCVYCVCVCLCVCVCFVCVCVFCVCVCFVCVCVCVCVCVQNTRPTLTGQQYTT